MALYRGQKLQNAQSNAANNSRTGCMIDKNLRNTYRVLLAQFHGEIITNTQLIDRIDEIGDDSSDPAILAIVKQIENLFDDTLRTYYLSDLEDKQFIARIMEFLDTEIEYKENPEDKKRILKNECRNLVLSPVLSLVLNVITLGLYNLFYVLFAKPGYATVQDYCKRELWDSWPFPVKKNDTVVPDEK